MIDVTQTMACIQCGACVSDCLSMEVDPLFIGPAALAKAYRFVGDPRDGQQYERLKDLAEDPHGIYDCTHCFNCIEACPKGVAPMSQIMRLRRIAGADHGINDRNNGHRHEKAFVKNDRAATACCTRPTCCRDSYGGDAASSTRAPCRSWSARCPSILKALQRGKVTPKAALCRTSAKARPRGGQAHLPARSHDREERYELNLYVVGEEEEPAEARRSTPTRPGATCPQRGARTREGRVLARLREPRLHPRAARLDGEGRAAARHRARRARPRRAAAAPA